MVATLELDEDVLGLVAELSGDPFGPRLGAALNVTALPMGDQLHLGITTDPPQSPTAPCSWRPCGVPSARSSVPALPASSRRSLPSVRGASNDKPAVVRRPVARFRRPTHRAWRGRTARPRPRRGRRWGGRTGGPRSKPRGGGGAGGTAHRT